MFALITWILIPSFIGIATLVQSFRVSLGRRTFLNWVFTSIIIAIVTVGLRILYQMVFKVSWAGFQSLYFFAAALCLFSIQRVIDLRSSNS